MGVTVGKGGRGRMEKGVNGTQREQAAHSFINFRTFQSSCARSHEGSCEYAVPGEERLRMKLSNAKYILSSRVNA